MSDFYWTLGNHQHPISTAAFYDQGGGIEEIFVWCHNCDPEGAATEMTLDTEDVPYESGMTRGQWVAAVKARVEEKAEQHINPGWFELKKQGDA